MRIKIAILEKNQNYLNRIANVFNFKYADRLEVYSFTDLSMAVQTLKNNRINVFLASDCFDVNTADIPKKCGFAYLTESPYTDWVKEKRAICKFQKVDLIYKQVLSIYSEVAENISGVKFGDKQSKVIAFCSPCGGVGTSSMAAAAAIHYASQNKKTLYLNLEKFGKSDIYFSGEGQFDFGNVIFALKSKKANLALKLASCVKQDKNGVYFFSQARLALDMHELTTEDIITLITELRAAGSYEYVILDMDFGIDEGTRSVLHQVNAIVVVSDGSENANVKLFRAYQALSLLEQDKDIQLIDRTVLTYNKFSNKTAKILEGLDIKDIGGVPRYEHATSQQVLQQLSSMSMYDRIL